MNILYIHGFGSKFDPESSKVKALTNLGPVYGVDIDYTQPSYKSYPRIQRAVVDNKIDLVVGCSMGGNKAAQVSADFGIPFIAMNPAINPRESLKRYIGKGVTYTGEEYELTEEVVDTYSSMPRSGDGMILLDDGDTVLDSAETAEVYGADYECITFLGGSHRFEHTEEALHMIKAFYSNKG